MRAAADPRTGRPVLNKVVYIVDARGQKIPISISTAVLKDERGRVIGGVESFRDLRLVEELHLELQQQNSFSDIIGRSAAMRQLFEILPQVAESEATVLIEGASGTGKELVARALHNLSRRAKHPFVAVNCGALPDTLLESELFGYKAGAFTDARRDKPGRFALAEGGTIFLDEIGDISAAMQTRLSGVAGTEPMNRWARCAVKANVRGLRDERNLRNVRRAISAKTCSTAFTLCGSSCPGCGSGGRNSAVGGSFHCRFNRLMERTSRESPTKCWRG